jgi:hypothetical protein
MSSPQTRRRQRSTRLAVAAALVITAAVVVIGAVLSASLTFVSVAAVLAVFLGAAAVRITHSELLQARRDAAADLAHQAQGYRTITEQRSREHRGFVGAMGTRVGKAEQAAIQLESAVVASQGRAAESMRRLNAEARRADLAEAEGSRLAVALEESDERAAEAIVRVAELEDENGTLRTENDVLKSELDAAQWQPHVKHA